MPTILDVAKRAGVSKTLVSRVINGQSGVGEENRERILKAIKELGYKPNMLARSLVLKQTNTIGVILDSLCVPFYFDFIRSVMQQGQTLGYSMLFCAEANDINAKSRYMNHFTQGNADGIIIYGSSFADTQIISNLAKTEFPLVVVEHDIEEASTNKVLVDNVQGARMAVNHLISKGCKDIRHFMGDPYKKVYLDRLKGYKEAMSESGLAVKEESILYSQFTEQSGYENMMRLIQANDVPEAIFCSGDVIAFGVIRALVKNNYSIPRDIKIVGFDDDRPDSFDMVFPGLTTVRQPLEEIGKEAIAMLDYIIKNRSKVHKKMMIMPELIIRETT